MAESSMIIETELVTPATAPSWTDSMLERKPLVQKVLGQDGVSATGSVKPGKHLHLRRLLPPEPELRRSTAFFILDATLRLCCVFATLAKVHVSGPALSTQRPSRSFRRPSHDTSVSLLKCMDCLRQIRAVRQYVRKARTTIDGAGIHRLLSLLEHLIFCGGAEPIRRRTERLAKLCWAVPKTSHSLLVDLLNISRPLLRRNNKLLSPAPALRDNIRAYARTGACAHPGYPQSSEKPRSDISRDKVPAARWFETPH